MTLYQSYRAFINGLEAIYEKPEGANITSLIFEKLAGVKKQDVIKDSDVGLSDNIISKLNQALNRLKQHEPVQYILGEAWFYNLNFIVSPAVLIPRPETEELTDAVVHYLKPAPPAKVLDIGTGSGCIAIAIKKNIPAATITATDTSNDALEVARLNATKHETDIDFQMLDFLDETSWENLEQYDVIVSNPPYIPLSEKDSMNEIVTAHEPHLALFVDDERPLLFYGKIAVFGINHMKTGAKIFLEIHEGFAQQVRKLFEENDYSCKIENDMQGKERMVIATRHSR